MSEWQTEEEFAQNLNTVFRVNLETAKPIELILTEVKGRPSEANESSGMERFSVFFAGPLDVFLPQHIYPLIHEKMGEFEIFLVPIGKEADAFRYEAVFNFFKSAAPPKAQETSK